MADVPGVTREIVLGVDFGTSYTSAGALIDGQVQLVVDSGDEMIPTVVHLPDRGPPEVGRRAVPFLMSEPTATVASVKRLMGSGHDDALLRAIAPTLPYRVQGSPSGAVVLRIRNQDWTVEQVAAHVLERVRALAEHRFGGVVRRIVATASAVATRRYQTALGIAARLAHLDIVGTVAEPIAGALALGLHASPERRRLAVCDFGGGTFDITLIEQRGLRFDVIATGGDPFLGGNDLDGAMVDALAGLIYRKSRFDLTRDAVRRQALGLRCESVKRALSTTDEARLMMREAYLERGDTRDLDVIIDREWVQPLWDPLFARALGEVDRVLTHAGWRGDDLDEVALIGGTALVPRFQELVRARFPRRTVTVSPLASVAVAIGATLLTARHVGDDVPVLGHTSLAAGPAVA